MFGKTWFKLVLMLLLVGVVASAVPIIVPPRPGVTYANYGRLEVGMTLRDVEALLGKPGRVDTGGLAWESEEHDQVWIEFDKEGRVQQFTWNGFPEFRSGVQKVIDRYPWIGNPPPQPKAPFKPMP